MLEKKISTTLINLVKDTFDAEITPDHVQLQPTRKEFDGDITLVVFPLLKITRKSPEESAKTIGKGLMKQLEEVQNFNVVKGFLNLTISTTYWLEIFNAGNNASQFGFSPKSGLLKMVEYSSPNTNKPLHLGHLRNNFLGYSVSKILEANAHEVAKVQIINDRGIHICKSMLAWQLFGNGETPESSGLKGDKLVGKYYVEFDTHYKKEIQQLIAEGKTEEEAKKQAPILLKAQDLLKKWEDKDKETIALWEKMNGWVYEGFDATYRTMGVAFDKLYYESNTYLLGKQIAEENIGTHFYKKDDGSVWCDLTDEGLDRKLLLRSDGTSVYMTQDIGTAILRFKDYPTLQQQIYTVGNEQEYHFKVLFKILEKLGYEWAKECYHLSYGMVDLPTGKMKSREGTVVDADDLMRDVMKTAEKKTNELGKLDEASEQEKRKLYNTIGIGAVKYYLLKVDPRKRMLFNPDESVDLNGNTAPFIQYAYARIQSILRKANRNQEEIKAHLKLEKTEKELVKVIMDFPSTVKEAGREYSPAIVANYVYELTKKFNSFYQSVSVLNANEKEVITLRIELCRMTGKTIRQAMGLLGIDVPDRM